MWSLMVDLVHQTVLVQHHIWTSSLLLCVNCDSSKWLEHNSSLYNFCKGMCLRSSHIVSWTPFPHCSSCFGNLNIDNLWFLLELWQFIAVQYKPKVFLIHHFFDSLFEASVSIPKNLQSMVCYISNQSFWWNEFENHNNFNIELIMNPIWQKTLIPLPPSDRCKN